MAAPRQAPYLFPQGAHLGIDNLVLHARARHHQVQSFAGPLSIKTVLAGQVTWIVNQRALTIDPTSFLVLSAGEKYSMNISEHKPVETCCVFFAPAFVERVALDLTSPVQHALDDPGRPVCGLPYLSALHTALDHSLIQRVHTLARRCKPALSPSGFEEEFLSLACALLQLYEQIREQAARVPALRPGTRHELFRRLLTAREYIHSHASDPVSLTSTARAACLSPYHFHRCFTQTFQQTPHQYLTNLRLAQARHKVESGSAVLEAALEAGFSSPSAFSRLFRSRYGEPPSTVRRKFARSGKNAHPGSGTLSA